MKKMLSVLAISVILLLPLKARAYTIITGTNNKCESVCKEENNKCSAVCPIRVEGNTSSMAEFNATITFANEGVTITSVEPGDGWTNLNGNSTNLSLVASNGGITSSNFTLATINIEYDSDIEDCSLALNVDGVKYEVTVKEETTVKTGATLPIAILACGAGIAVVIYLLASKNKKMYKI